eukprot:10834672-Karenia_brevis.AAC.1
MEQRVPADRESPEAAYEVLLGTKAFSYEEGTNGPAPFVPDLVSRPSRAGDCRLADVLPDKEGVDLQRFEERLRLKDVEVEAVVAAEGKANVYWDPILRHNYDKYAAFIKDLSSR